MTAYLDKKEDIFTQNECITWAKKLVEEAKSSYSYIGKICYQQIKQNAGKTIEDSQSTNQTMENNGKNYELYGNVKIEFMPFINETIEKNEKDGKDQLKNDNPKILDPKILDINLSILKKENEFPSRYLFGVHSSIILFSMGMLKLCKKDSFNKNDIEDVKKMIQCIEDAKRMFIFCSAIAEEGGNEKDQVITRDLLPTEQENITSDFDSPIKILYPHRLTQFADLGKIFAATCYAILNYQEDECKYNKLYEKLEEGLLKQLGKNPKSRDARSKILEQTKFNGHLETHIRDIKQYFEGLPKYFESLPKNEDLSVIRDKIVTDIFKIIRGESVRG
jgi:hypothetical protein